jgi:hypothetical protein
MPRFHCRGCKLILFSFYKQIVCKLNSLTCVAQVLMLNCHINMESSKRKQGVSDKKREARASGRYEFVMHQRKASTFQAARYRHKASKSWDGSNTSQKGLEEGRGESRIQPWLVWGSWRPAATIACSKATRVASQRQSLERRGTLCITTMTLQKSTALC